LHAVAKALHSNKSLKYLSFIGETEEVIEQVVTSEYALASVKRYVLRMDPTFSPTLVQQTMSMI